MIKEINPEEFKQKFINNSFSLEIIDVRQPEEFAQIKIKGSKLVPMQQLGASLDSIDWTKEVVFVCRTGSRSGYVVNLLQQHGFDSQNLQGGIYMLSMNCQECIEKGVMDKTYFA